MPKAPTPKQLRAAREQRDALDRFLQEHAVTIYRLILSCPDDANATALGIAISGAGFTGHTSTNDPLTVRAVARRAGHLLRCDFDPAYAEDLSRMVDLYGGATGRQVITMEEVSPDVESGLQTEDQLLQSLIEAIMENPPLKAA